MKPPTEEDPKVVRSQRDFLRFVEEHVISRTWRGSGLMGMSDVAFYAHVKEHWKVPDSFPALVWTTVTEAAEEVGPTFPQTHIHIQTKREVKERLSLFD